MHTDLGAVGSGRNRSTFGDHTSTAHSLLIYSTEGHIVHGPASPGTYQLVATDSMDRFRRMLPVVDQLVDVSEKAEICSHHMAFSLDI